MLNTSFPIKLFLFYSTNTPPTYERSSLTVCRRRYCYRARYRERPPPGLRKLPCARAPRRLRPSLVPAPASLLHRCTPLNPRPVRPFLSAGAGVRLTVKLILLTQHRAMAREEGRKRIEEKIVISEKRPHAQSVLSYSLTEIIVLCARGKRPGIDHGNAVCVRV